MSQNVAAVEVQLLAMPVEKWARLVAHHETIRRELDIITTVRRDDLPLERINVYLDVLGRRMESLYDPVIDDLRTALHQGVTRIDLRVKMTPETIAEANELNTLLDEINDFCRDEDSLITVATPSDLVSFRRWMLGELTGRASGAEPRSWDAHAAETSSGPRSVSRAARGGAGDRAGVESEVTFSGELDLASAADLQTAIQDARHSGADSLTLDMTGVTFIDSVGLSLIVTAHNRLAEEGGILRVVLPGRLRPLLDLSGLLEVLEVRFVED